jgi:hypothetical protein
MLLVEKDFFMKISNHSIFLTCIAITDLLVTVVLILSGKFWEANPILSFYLNLSLFAFIFIKLLLILAPIFVLELLRTKQDNIKNFIKVTSWLYVAFYIGGVSCYNFS